MKRRITLVVDDDERARQGVGPFSRGCVIGATIESDEVIPERVQEFRVRVTTRTTDPPFSVTEINGIVQSGGIRSDYITVTEVQS